MTTQMKILFAVGGLVVIGGGVYLYRQHKAASITNPAAGLPNAANNAQLNYLQNWAATTGKQAYIQMVNSLNATDLATLYQIVYDYFDQQPNVALPSTLQNAWGQFITKFSLT
jgi:hypothetical protein